MLVEGESHAQPGNRGTARELPFFPKPPGFRPWLIAFFFFLYLLTPVTYPGDSHFTFFTASRLIQSGTPYMDQLVAKHGDALCRQLGCLETTALPFTIAKSRGHYLYYFPHGGAFLAMPLALAFRFGGIDAAGGDPAIRSFLARLAGRVLDRVGADTWVRARAEALLAPPPPGGYDVVGELLLQKVAAALWATGFVVLAAIFAGYWLPSLPAWGVTVLFGLGTSLASTLSRTYWADTPAVVLVLAALCLIYRRGGVNAVVAIGVGSLLAWSYFVKPVYALAVVCCLALWASRHGWKCVKPLVVAGSIWGVLFLAYWKLAWGEWLPPYYHLGRLSGQTDFWTAVAGNLVSPARGLLVFSPFLLLVFAALPVWWRWIPDRRGVVWALLAFVGLLVVVGRFPHWWGGYCFGPRLLAPALPFLLLLAVQVAAAGRIAFPRMGRGARIVVLSTLAVAAAASIAINTAGMLSFAANAWNQQHEVDVHPEALWTWRDPQFLAPF